MDYEKKYKEALERAMECVLHGRHLSVSANLAVLRAIEIVFPELRESEDEGIREELIYYLKESAEGITCIVSKKKFAEWATYLEKQKENPKTAISIPADCASNAKCEDKWHKVKDSLPDNAREVLCKDAISNYFIGRYYEDSNSWEVSMYDDADKSNEDNPPVVMWCDIPSEEQKPAEWNDKDLPQGGESIMINRILHSLKLYREMLKDSNFEEDYIKATLNDCLEDEKWLTSLEISQKPAGWSEEDKRKLNMLFSIVRQAADAHAFSTTTRLIGDKDAIELSDFLKSLSLRPQPHWKPNEEQLEALEYFVQKHKAEANAVTNVWIDYENLVSLRNDLKKL